MKTLTTKPQVFHSLLGVVCTLAMGLSPPAGAKDPPAVFLPGYTPAQQQSNFLTFPNNPVIQSPTTAKAYYDAIDPNGKKLTFTQWLVETGFIGQESDWQPTGAQDIRTGQPAGVYGPNVINTDSHVVVINNADLGFVRNQFIRCKPSCTAKNPIIYTYLENYFYDALLNEQQHGFPSQPEAKAAIEAAINTRERRVADVAFEWAPPPDGSSPSTRYGQLYAYIFHKDANGVITETRNWPDQPFLDAQFNARGDEAFPPIQFNPPPPVRYTVLAGQPFAPELDFHGVKQHPGACFMCHGGDPRNLTSTGKYPSQGRSSGFKFMPLDIDNLLFTSEDDGGDPNSRAAQEAQIKRYNQVVLRTHGAKPLSANLNGPWKIPQFADQQGVYRTPHAVEVILGWYGGSTANPIMPNPTQNTEFIPVGWREASHGGTAPAGSEELYLKAVAPACRSCHAQRESDVDFGTVGSFDANREDILEMVLKPECDADDPPPGKVLMPAAKRTYDLFWLENQDEYVKAHFGFTSTSYCAQPSLSKRSSPLLRQMLSALRHPLGKAGQQTLRR